MRQGGPGGRRPRGRHHGGHGGNNGGGNRHGGGNHGGGNHNPNDNRPRSAASLRHQTFDSNCIDLRVRGNAWQVHEKYQALARDATSSGDRVAAENYLQHAEHYYRIIEAINEATATEQRQRGGTPYAPFNQQPDVPANYYPPAAGTAQQQPGNPNAAADSQAAPAAAQAEVQKRNPSPFFTPEEAEEQSGAAEPLIASR
ncbi:MAG: DUF4167 domain-containing protein [Alphaproteobacteria bacterium]|nr:DUF4167 domain-containing protein [Alphaproteobacteria bacterium]